MKGLLIVGGILLLLVAITPWFAKNLPSAWNPFTPLQVTDSPTFVTRYKLQRLAGDPQACLAVLQQARQQGYLSFSQPAPTSGTCPLPAPIRVQRFGDVRLSSSFLASCSLAVSSTMFVTQTVKPLAAAELGSPLVRIDHLGSYACRNIYHRAEGRLSEHATADALDMSGFRLANGQQIGVLKTWSRQGNDAQWLHQIFQQSCRFYGNSIGPDYNAAHANHFHLGMRGRGFCR